MKTNGLLLGMDIAYARTVGLNLPSIYQSAATVQDILTSRGVFYVKGVIENYLVLTSSVVEIYIVNKKN